jgi:hypothetical protein
MLHHAVVGRGGIDDLNHGRTNNERAKNAHRDWTDGVAVLVPAPSGDSTALLKVVAHEASLAGVYLIACHCNSYPKICTDLILLAESNGYRADLLLLKNLQAIFNHSQSTNHSSFVRIGGPE